MNLITLISVAKQYWAGLPRNVRLGLTGFPAVCVLVLVLKPHNHAAAASTSECARDGVLSDVLASLRDTPGARKGQIEFREIVGPRSLEEIYARFFARFDATAADRARDAAQHPYGIISGQALALSGRTTLSGQPLDQSVTVPSANDQKRASDAAAAASAQDDANKRATIQSMERTEMEMDRRKGIYLDCYAKALTNIGIFNFRYFYQNVEGQSVVTTEAGSHPYYSDEDIEQAIH